jgi:5-methylcytosine-specific restriction protein B
VPAGSDTSRPVFDRTDPEATGRFLEELFPDPKLRRALLSILADSIEEAHRLNPASWSLTLGVRHSYLRLNVGRVFALSIYPDWTHLLLEKKFRKRGDALARAVEGVIWRGLTPESLTSEWPQLSDSHRKAIALSALRSKKTPYRGAHSPGVLVNISQWLNRPIPRPDHDASSQDGIDPAKVKNILRILRSKYPDWNGFDHPDFAKDEIDYKQKTIQKAQDVLAEPELQELLDRGNADEFLKRVQQIGRDNNLLFLRSPVGDLNILLELSRRDETLRIEFCRAFFDLLYGAGDSPERLERYVAWVENQGLPSKWTFPTYFLFACHPDSEIFTKPETTTAFLTLCGIKDKIRGAVNAEKYARVRDLAFSLMSALAEYQPRDMVDIQSIFWVCGYALTTPLLNEERRSEFKRLFDRFASEYIPTPQGARHVQLYTQVRHQAPENYKAIRNAKERGEDITDRALNLLLPHLDTPGNRERGSWIHFAPAVNKDLKSWFEGARWAKQEDWPRIAQDLWRFVETCTEHPDELENACTAFESSPSSKGLKTGMLTPILNALRPDDFLLFNYKSRETLNYLTRQKFGQSLSEYPKANETLLRLVEEVAPMMAAPGLPELWPGDLFDLFCHWLVAIEKIVINRPDDDEGLPVNIQSHYPLPDCADTTGFSEDALERWVRAIRRKKQAIFYGPPGTGKTHIARELARHLIGGGTGFEELVQFHPSYSYEEFIQGIRPEPIPGGGLDYPLKKGRFLEFCDRAREVGDSPCVLIIDEINRAHLSRVFGELMYLLEYRDKAIPLAAGRSFSIPDNVYILGTMNTADRSIALVDHALRRRFAFIGVQPNMEILRRKHSGFGWVEPLIEILEEVNREIASPHYEVGVTFFLGENVRSEIEDIWEMEIYPYLEEYFFDQPSRAEKFSWSNIRGRLGS